MCPVTTPDATDDTETRTRLGQLVERRRLELGHSLRAAATNAGVARDTWTGLENATRRTAQHAYAGIERALQWAPGSIQAILNGGQPTPLDQPPPVANQAATTATGLEDEDPVVALALADMDDDIRQQIVATLLAERRQFVRRRAAELVRDVLHRQSAPPQG